VLDTLGIVADLGTITEAERLSGLLTELQTGNRRRRAVAFSKFIGISISLDSQTEVLIGTKVQVLHVVGPQGVRFTTGGALVNSGNTVPGITGRIRIAGVSYLRIDNCVIYAGLIKTLAVFVPYKFLEFGIGHGIILLRLVIKIENMMIQTIGDEHSVIAAQRKTLQYSQWNIRLRVICDISKLVSCLVTV
jgi:hypothetical protein